MNATKLFATVATVVAVVGATGLAYAEIKQESAPSRQNGKDVESTGSMRARIPATPAAAPAPAPAAAMTTTAAPTYVAPTAATPVYTPAPAPMASEPMARADRN